MIVSYNSNLFIVEATGKSELEAISGSKKLRVISDYNNKGVEGAIIIRKIVCPQLRELVHSGTRYGPFNTSKYILVSKHSDIQHNDAKHNDIHCLFSAFLC
jgi:hypothetical protein